LVDEPVDLCIAGANGTVIMNVTMATMKDSISVNNITNIVNATVSSVL
jgi:hypothetical protein